MNWADRQREFREMHPPELGEKMIWVKGGGARNRKECPFVTVWFVQVTNYNWLVMDVEGGAHNVLPSRLFTTKEFEEWIEGHEQANKPLALNVQTSEDVEQDAERLRDLPPDLLDQLSPAFKERYGLGHCLDILDETPHKLERASPTLTCDHICNGRVYAICKKCGATTGRDGREALYS